jgi:outer membrane protein insertion porin family
MVQGGAKRWKRLGVVVALVALYVSGMPLAHAASGIVKEIEFSGNVRTPEQTLRSTIRTAVGQPLDAATVDRDIAALYRLGQFRDIRVEGKPTAGGVVLTYILEEKSLVAEIEFEGNKKIKADDLRSEITQRNYSVLDEKAVAESMEKIRAAYAKKGFYLAEVGYRIEPTAQGDSKLIFEVHEHEGVTVRRILFVGNKVFSDDELRKVVRTRQKGAFSFLTSSGKYEEEMLKNDMLLLAFHYLNHGYLKVKVSPPKTTISKDKRYIFVSFEIHEGQQYKVGNVSVSGDILTTPEELQAGLTTKPGQTYSQRKLEEDILKLTEMYGDEGYAYASIVPNTIPNDEARTADIDIRIAKGNRITIEHINISGNTTTRDKVIRRELELKEQDRYSDRSLRKSRENLMRLGYFEEVNFATPRGSRDNTMVLNITVKERATGTFNIGVGFSSVEHFMFNASIQKENFFGYGISGNISAELSSKRQLFMLAVNDPYFLDTKWMAGLSAYRNAYHYTDFRRESTGGDVTLGHRFFRDFSAQLGYTIEQVKVNDFAYTVPQFFQQDASGLTSALNLTLAYDTRDNRIMPTKGLYEIVSQEISGTKLGGDNDFYRVNFRSMYYQPLWKNLVFKQFFRVGYIKSLNDKPVPLFERFFAGGVFSLRGYEPDSVGPRLRIPNSISGSVEDFTYGGNKLMLFVTELELPIYDKAGIRAVAFFDAGNAYAENENFSFTNMQTDAGVGLRWNSPMGPLRFEWGFPINKRPGDSSVVFNFTIGNFF